MKFRHRHLVDAFFFNTLSNKIRKNKMKNDKFRFCSDFFENTANSYRFQYPNVTAQIWGTLDILNSVTINLGTQWFKLQNTVFASDIIFWFLCYNFFSFFSLLQFPANTLFLIDLTPSSVINQKQKHAYQFFQLNKRYLRNAWKLLLNIRKPIKQPHTGKKIDAS